MNLEEKYEPLPLLSFEEQLKYRKAWIVRFDNDSTGRSHTGLLDYDSAQKYAESLRAAKFQNVEVVLA